MTASGGGTFPSGCSHVTVSIMKHDTNRYSTLRRRTKTERPPRFSLSVVAGFYITHALIIEGYVTTD